MKRALSTKEAGVFLLTLFVAILLTVFYMGKLMPPPPLPLGYITTPVTPESFLSPEILNKWRQDGGFIHSGFKRGAKNQEVVYLQNYLHLLYPDKVSDIDGVYGLGTMSAIEDFQKAHNIFASGIFDEQTREIMNGIFVGQLCPLPDEPTPDLLLYPISKELGVDSSYVPSDLVRLPTFVRTSGIICMRQEAAQAYASMVSDAHKVGLTIVANSGFRKYEVQDYLREVYSQTLGQAQADRVSAPPGHSEHQLGTAIDVTGASIGYQGTSTTFGSSPEWIWMNEHQYEYGFVQSFPEGKEAVSGYQFEPWHFRYVGIPMADKIRASAKTPLEVLKDAWTLNQKQT